MCKLKFDEGSSSYVMCMCRGLDSLDGHVSKVRVGELGT